MNSYINKYGIIAVFILVWIIVSAMGFFNPLLVPSFFNVFKELSCFFTTGKIAIHLWATLARVFISFLGAMLLGVPIGFLMGYFKKIYQALELPIDFLRSIPATALFPLFIILLGIGEIARMSLAIFSCTLIIIITTANGVKNSKEIRRMVGVTMRATKYQIFTKIIFFETLPEVITGLKVALSIAIILIIITEMFIGPQFGLGKIIYEDHLTFEIPRMYAAIILVGAIGYTLNKIISYFQSRFLHWAVKR